METKTFNVIQQKGEFYNHCIENGMNLGQVYNIRKDAMRAGYTFIKCGFDSQGRFDPQPVVTKESIAKRNRGGASE